MHVGVMSPYLLGREIILSSLVHSFLMFQMRAGLVSVALVVTSYAIVSTADPISLGAIAPFLLVGLFALKV